MIDKLEEDTYPIKYSVEFGNWTIEEIGSDGGCDQLLLVSITGRLATNGESVSIRFIGVDGKSKQDLNSAQLFQIWATMAGNLSECEDLSPKMKTIAEVAFDIVKSQILELDKLGEENA